MSTESNLVWQYTIQLFLPILLAVVTFRYALRAGTRPFSLTHPVLQARVVSALLLITASLPSLGEEPETVLRIHNPTLTILVTIASIIIFPIGLSRALRTNAQLAESYPQIRSMKEKPLHIILNAATWLLYLFAYELTFRGTLLFSLLQHSGMIISVGVNIIVYTIAHAHKGSREMLASTPFGLLLCLLSLLTGDFWAAFAVHSCLALSMEWLSLKLLRSQVLQQKSATGPGAKDLPVVLITGGSAGIGKALAIAFAKRGKDLLLVALPDTGLEDIARSIREQHQVRVFTLALDLTEKESASHCYNFCRRHSLRVNVLVNNAGFGTLEPFDATPASRLQQLIQLNNVALVLMTHTFLSHLKSAPESYILNVGSLAGFMPLPKKAVYAASKSFVFTFSYSLFIELRPFNIHVSCLCPGGTLTERVIEMLREKNLNRTGFCQRPEAVADEAVRSLYKKRFTIIPGMQNKALYLLARTLPGVLKTPLIRLAFRQSQGKARANRLSPTRAMAMVVR